MKLRITAVAIVAFCLQALVVVQAAPPLPLFQDSFDDGEQPGVVGQGGQDMLVDAPGNIDLDRGTLAFFSKRTHREPAPWWTSKRATYPAVDRHGYRRIGGIAQGLGEGYYFQGLGFEVWTDELMFLFLDAGRLSPPIRLGALDDLWPVDTWRHLAVVWDRNQGITLYMDGQEIWSNWGAYQWQWNLLPRALFLNGIGDEFRVYAECLTAAQVAQLAAGTPPTGEPLAVEDTPQRLENERRRYGWQQDRLDALPVVPGGEGLALEFARIDRMAEWNRPQAQPRDGLKTTTWPPIYYGPALKGQRLETDLAEGATYTHIRAFIQRPFDGAIEAAGAQIPLRTETATVWHHRLAEPVTDPHVVLHRRQGQLGRLDFFRTRPVDSATAQLLLAPGAFPDTDLGRIVATEVPTRFHQPLAARPDAVAGWALEVPAFGGFQAFTTPPESAAAYEGVVISLVAEQMTGPTPVRITIKEPVHSEKDWLVAEAVLQPDGQGRQTFTLALQGRPVINLPPMQVRHFRSDGPFEPLPGTAFGVTVTAGAPVTWAMGEGGSGLTFMAADLEAVLPQAADDQIAFMRQGFATLMEGHRYDDPRMQLPLLWLARFAPDRKPFKQLARRAMLRTVFEGYEPPGFETHAEPDNPWQAPAWALWQRELMQEIREMVYWRIDTMQLPTGELGSTFNDDSIHAEGWFNYALCMDDSGKIAASLRRFHEGLFRYGLDRGVTRYITDAGHASEEGGSSIAMAIMLDYGDPLTFERLLQAASHYDKWLKKTDAGFEAKSAYVGAPGAWDFGEFSQAYGSGVHQLMVPAGYLTWYNRHPVAWAYLDGVIDAYPKGQGRMTTFFASARAWWHGEETVDPGLDPAAKMKPYKPLNRPFRPYRSRGADDEPLWKRWRETGDDRYLVDLYRGAVEWFDNYDWLITEAMPALDRIAEPTAGFAASRMGDKASDRASAYLTWPEYAVTYTSGADALAAVVTANRIDHLAMRFFPFTAEPHAVQLRLWRLHPGTYQVTLKLGEQELFSEQRVVRRGSFLELTLPPAQLSDLTINPIVTQAPDFTLPDPAISLDTIDVIYARHLIVKVHNLGSTAAENVRVRVRDRHSGELIPRGEQIIQRIEPALDFEPSYQAVQFDDIYAVSRSLSVELVSDQPDLNPWNNRVDLTDAHILGPAYIGIERRARLPNPSEPLVPTP